MKRRCKRFLRLCKDIKLRHKLFITYAFVAILPIMVFGGFCYKQTKSLLLSHETSNMKDCLEQASLRMENEIESYNTLSNYMANNQAIGQVLTNKYESSSKGKESLTERLDPMVASLKYVHNNINQITIYTSNASVTNDTTVRPLTQVEESDWYKKIKKISSKDIEWFVSEKEKRAFSARVMPLLEESDDQGILYIDVNYEKLFAPLKEVMSSSFGIYVVKEDDAVIYAYDTYSNKNAGSKLSYSGLRAQMQEKKADYTTVKKDMPSGWTILLYKPSSAIMDSVGSIAIITIVVMACCLGISLLTTTAISKVMVSDIEKLTANMKQVQTGNMEITVTSNSKDEVGNLIRGFGMMMERIHLLINEVYEGELAQKEYEMKALQAQINPHFLYNSLSLINWKAIEAKEPEISKITLLLSSFYRTALNRGDNILSVKDELTNVKSYLDIQLMMHENSFDVVMDIAEEMKEYQTLNLILQPIVENAINHGIDLLTDRRGSIRIMGRLENATIVFTVEDNGVGMEPEKVQTILTKKSKGYGIRNVNERIRLLYGQQYGLEVFSVVGEGTRIVVTMPAIKAYE